MGVWVQVGGVTVGVWVQMGGVTVGVWVQMGGVVVGESLSTDGCHCVSSNGWANVTVWVGGGHCVGFNGWMGGIFMETLSMPSQCVTLEQP